jgi:hypothetical protein
MGDFDQFIVIPWPYTTNHKWLIGRRSEFHMALGPSDDNEHGSFIVETNLDREGPSRLRLNGEAI